MTLILTRFSPESIVQVSDTRLTYSSGNSEDIARKILFYKSSDAHLAIAYTGLASFQESSVSEVITIEDWLAKEIASNSLGTPLLQVIDKLTERVGEIVTKTEKLYRLNRSQLSIIFSGFLSNISTPILICISNFEKLGTEIPPLGNRIKNLRTITVGEKIAQSGNFSSHFSLYHAKSVGFVVYADLSAINKQVVIDLYRETRKISRRRLGQQAIKKNLVNTLRLAASVSPKLTVSKDCWSCYLARNDPNVLYDAHFHEKRRITISPRFVGPNFQVELWHIDNETLEKEYESYKVLIKNGNLDIPLNQFSLRAYLDVSPTIEAMVNSVRELGVEVDMVGRFDTDIRMANKINIISIQMLENMVKTSQNWFVQLAKAYFKNQATFFSSMNSGSSESKIRIDRNAIIVLCLVGSRPDVFTNEILLGEFHWSLPEQITKPAQEIKSRSS